MGSLQERALEAMPAGVNSPVRAFKSVGGNPFYASHAEGAHLVTTDKRELIDFCMSFGPLILGHAHLNSIIAIREAAERGTSFAVTTDAEIQLAELIKEAIPGLNRIRLVNSGTEACMTALRLARGFTGRKKILKFSGCYHGHCDPVLVEAGSGVAGIATASSAGVTEGTAADTIIVPFNDRKRTIERVRKHGNDLAAIIVEPIAANMGLIAPEPGFIELLRLLCYSTGALLIFDEVITGFRLNFGGHQNISGITPDLTCLGKVIGGGMPIGAVGGREDILDTLAPLGPVYQAGTLSGNPISVAAGLATLKTLRDTDPYDDLRKAAELFVGRLQESAEDHGVPVQIPQIGSMFSFFFTDTPVRSFSDVHTTDKDKFTPFFHTLLENGVYLPPSPFETCFISTAHDEEVLNEAVEAFDMAFSAIAG